MSKKTAEPTAPEMEVLTLPVAELHLDPANARRHPDRNLDAIKASLARFGQQTPIVIDANNVVRKGNGTLASAKALGWETIRCVRSELKGSEATAYAVSDNRTSELAEWDSDGLASTLEALRDEDFDLSAVGFTDGELDELLKQEEVPAFEPVGADEQGNLDEKAKIACPECGHEFAP